MWDFGFWRRIRQEKRNVIRNSVGRCGKCAYIMGFGGFGLVCMVGVWVGGLVYSCGYDYMLGHRITLYMDIGRGRDAFLAFRKNSISYLYCAIDIW